LSESAKGIKDACIEFDTPVTGGNVSLYNETNGIDIWPTPVIGMVGYLENVSSTIDHSFKNTGNIIMLLGVQKNEIGASEYLYLRTNEYKGKVPELDFQLEKKVQESVRELIKKKLVKSAHDCSIGGLLVTLCECAFYNDLGFNLAFGSTPFTSRARFDASLFGETQSRIVISVEKSNLKIVENHLKEKNCPYELIGEVTDSTVEISSLGLKTSARELKQIWSSSLEEKLSR